MIPPLLPGREHLTICFAHVAYRLGERFALRKTGIPCFELRSPDALAARAMALILALARQLPQARDHQARRVWRGMISDPALREDELSEKTLLIVGLGRIGSRLAALARVFGMRVIATKRNPAVGSDSAETVLAH